MNKSSFKKFIRNFIIFLTLIIFTFWIIFKDQDIRDLINILKTANLFYILIGIIIMMLYFLIESINIKSILKSFGERISLIRAYKYTLIGFFFSAITPAASGGQPMEIYYMRKDGIPVANSTLALLIQLCGFQISTITLGIICAILNPYFLNGGFTFLFIIGISLNMSALILLLIGIFSKRLTKKLVDLLVKILEFFKVKKIDSKKEKIKATFETYNESSRYIKNHKSEFLKAIFRVFIQVVLYYSVPFFVYKSFGLNEHNILKLFSLQAVLYCTTSGIPLPGSIGISEGVFLGIYGIAFGDEFLNSGMLLFRGITFYLFVIISHFVVIINAIKSKKNNKLKFVELNKDNLKVASEIQIEIFPNSCAYHIYKEYVNGKIKNYFSTYVAYLQDIPIGIVGLYELPEYPNTIWLNWFGVLSEYRNMGFGKQMFYYITEKAKERKKDFLRLYTSDLYNKEAINFYKKNMEIKESYFNELEDKKDIIEKIKPQIYGLSLSKKKIDLWNNKFINISDDIKIHNKSISEFNNDFQYLNKKRLL